MATVSDVQLRESLLAILDGADLNVVTERIIRKQLEEEFQCPLIDKKEFLKEEIGIFLKKKEEEAATVAASVTDETPAKKRKSRKPQEEKGESKRGAGSGGLNKVCLLSPELAGLFGVAELPRTQIVKEVWNYIREHDLQDPENKRLIACDETLEKILGTKKTDMFQMNKLLSRHIFSKPTEGETEPAVKKPKKVPTPNPSSISIQFRVEQKLSDELQLFFGTGETELPRQDVVKRMWNYIKDNSLQDPNDKKFILCDDKMKALFGVESFNGFGITKLLAPHIGVKSNDAAPTEPKKDNPDDRELTCGEAPEDFDDGMEAGEEVLV